MLDTQYPCKKTGVSITKKRLGSAIAVRVAIAAIMNSPILPAGKIRTEFPVKPYCKTRATTF